MPKKKMTRTTSKKQNIDNIYIIVLLLGVTFGFIAGYLFTKNRYMQRIDEISVMNMNKSNMINELRDELQVLGVSTEEK